MYLSTLVFDFDSFCFVRLCCYGWTSRIGSVPIHDGRRCFGERSTDFATNHGSTAGWDVYIVVYITKSQKTNTVILQAKMMSMAKGENEVRYRPHFTPWRQTNEFPLPLTFTRTIWYTRPSKRLWAGCGKTPS